MSTTQDAKDRAAATKLAGRVFLVLTITAIVAFAGGEVWLAVTATDPTGTITKVETPASRTVETLTVDVQGEKLVDPQTTKETTVDKGTEITTVTEDETSDGSMLGTVLQNPASRWLLELLAAVLVGFIAAAAAQRVYLGRYGLKVGSLEISELPEVSEPQVKATVDTITRAQIPQPVQGFDRPVPLPWWSEDPDVTSPNDALRYQRVALESGVRTLAERSDVRQSASVRKVVLALTERDTYSAEFALGLLELIALGNRVIGGAVVADDAVTPLFVANKHAIDVIAGHVRRRG